MANETPTEARLQELRQIVVGARSVPMSASCMVNRDEIVAAIDRIAQGLTADFQSYALHTSSDQARAAEIINQARQEANRIISQTEIVRQAEVQAAQIVARARAESEELLVEADRYVETRLASFEAELQVTMSRVTQMRERLLDRSQLGEVQVSTGETVWPANWSA
ncbi:MAG: hypothetical protein LBL92_05940 [Propionibacteriaceae bacterium]|jgi:vacuolar-type H+-ATPase subunit H|nr:hypothetical protein [Propionibacteriaceae bacterium]